MARVLHRYALAGMLFRIRSWLAEIVFDVRTGVSDVRWGGGRFFWLVLVNAYVDVDVNACSKFWPQSTRKLNSHCRNAETSPKVYFALIRANRHLICQSSQYAMIRSCIITFEQMKMEKCRLDARGGGGGGGGCVHFFSWEHLHFS